jgi:hypothetical protein
MIMSSEIQNNELPRLKLLPQRKGFRKEHSLLRSKLVSLSASVLVLVSNMRPVLAAIESSSPPYIKMGTAQGFSYFGRGKIAWAQCADGAGIGLSNRYIFVHGDTGQKMGYVVRYPKEAPNRFDTFRFSSQVSRCARSFRFILFFQNLKSGGTFVLNLSGDDIDVSKGGQENLYVPRKHYGSDARLKDCRLYKILVEWESPNWRDDASLYDIPVTFLDSAGKPVELHAKDICWDCMSEEAYNQDPTCFTSSLRSVWLNTHYGTLLSAHFL